LSATNPAQRGVDGSAVHAFNHTMISPVKHTMIMPVKHALISQVKHR